MSSRAPGSAAPPPLTLPWTATDPRGYMVILTAGTWRHASPHFPAFAKISAHPAIAAFGPVTQTLENPEFIQDNAARLGAPRRKGHERYVRYDVHLGKYLTIPVKKLDVLTQVEGVDYPAGSRLAMTFYTSPKPQFGNIIWK